MTSHAQTFKVNISPKHVAKIDKGKSARDKLKKYRKYYSKDSAKQMRKQDKKLDKKSDSLAGVQRKQQRKERIAARKGIIAPLDTASFLQQYTALLPKDSIARDSLKAEGKEIAKEKTFEELQDRYGLNPEEAKQYLEGDSAAMEKVKKKSLVLAKEESIKQLPPEQRRQLEAMQDEYGEYAPEVKQYLVFLKDSVDRKERMKELVTNKTEQMSTEMIGGRMGGGGANMKQLSEYSSKLDEFKNTGEQYSDPEAMKSEAKEKAKEQALERAMEHAQKVEAVQGKLGKLKGKFSSLTNSNDLSTGIKARSLEGTPIRERWVIGGNFAIASTAPLMIDLNPQFGYKIDKRLQVGVGGIYRTVFVDSVKIANSVSPERYGYSVFSSYGLIMNFFAYAEWERTTIIARGTGPDPKTAKQWKSSLLMGLGRQFQIHPKIKGSILLLWNPLHKNGNSPYHDAFVIKTGFQLTDLALMKKK